VPRRRTWQTALIALAAFASLAAIAPALIETTKSMTFEATAGQEFDGRVAEFHSSRKESSPGEYEATIYWGDGTPKSAATIEPKVGEAESYYVRGKHTYSSGGTCKVTVELREKGYPEGNYSDFKTIESTANVSGTAGTACGGTANEPPKDPPTAGIAAPDKKLRQGYIALIGSLSKPGSSAIVNYHWDFGDGKTADETDQGGNTNHIYDDPGTYQVTLTVTDANGLKATATSTREVIGVPKAVIDFTPDHGKKNTKFTFRGNKSSVPEGTIVRWQWRCLGKKVIEDDSADKKHKGPKDGTTCVFGHEKLSTAQLIVTSDQGEKAVTNVSVPVLPKFPPKAAISHGPEEPSVDQLVTFDASQSKSDPKGDGEGITNYHWDWGNGEVQDTASPTVQHAFSGDPGPRKVFLTVTDAEGSTTIQDVVWVTSKCVSDTTVRGLQLRGECLLESSCGDGSASRCYSGLPGMTVKMNGVDIVPPQDASIYASQSSGRVNTGGWGVTNIMFGPFRVGGSYDYEFTVPEGGGPKVINDSWRVNGKIHGFGAQSDPIVFNPDGSSFVPVNVKLPAPLQNVSGHVDLAATNDTPVFLGTLHIEAHNIPFPPFNIRDVVFDYTEANDSWFGSLALDTPYGTFGGDVGFVGGAFNHLGLFGENMNLALGQGIFLQRINGSYTVNPRQITAGVGLTIGPELAIPGVGAGSLVGIDGSWNLTYRTDGGWSTGINATASVISVPVGEMSATYDSIGRFDTTVHFNTTLYTVFDVNAFFNLVYYDPSLFQANAGIDICTKYIVHECAGGEIVISSVGIGACIYLPWFLPNVGGYYRWGEGGVNYYFSGCSVGDVKIQVARIRPAQSRSFTVAKGTQSEVLAFEGQDGPPKVSLTGPGGQHVDTPADGYDMTEPFFVSQEPKDKKTYVMISRPNAGKWTVTVADGSTPIVKMERAQGLPDPKVKARVTGSGTRRRLVYEATPIQGQRITFSEQGAKAGDTIGTTTKARGSFAFTPTDGPKEKRTIVAEVLQGGNPRANLKVATYSAPRVAPGKPRSLKLRRKGSGLLATWGAAPGATGYAVQVTLSDGRRIPILTPKRTVTIPGFAKTENATVSVAGYRLQGFNGPAAKASLKPPKAKKKKKR
jgi:PKD repeat protein